MKPYCWKSKRGSDKIHPADKCGICSENNKNTKGARRLRDKRDLEDMIADLEKDVWMSGVPCSIMDIIWCDA